MKEYIQRGEIEKESDLWESMRDFVKSHEISINNLRIHNYFVYDDYKNINWGQSWSDIDDILHKGTVMYKSDGSIQWERTIYDKYDTAGNWLEHKEFKADGSIFYQKCWGWEYDKSNTPIDYHCYKPNGEKYIVHQYDFGRKTNNFDTKSVVAGVVIGALSFIGCRIIESKIKSKK